MSSGFRSLLILVRCPTLSVLPGLPFIKALLDNTFVNADNYLSRIFRQVQMKQSYVYILASKRNGTLYIGLTSDLSKRIWEHKNKFVPGFTKQYNVTMLVYYEIFNDITLAAAREKRLKEWKRQWKIDLIEKMNVNWRDLFYEIVQ